MVVILIKTPFERLNPRVKIIETLNLSKTKLFQNALYELLLNATLADNATAFKEFIEISKKSLDCHA